MLLQFPSPGVSGTRKIETAPIKKATAVSVKAAPTPKWVEGEAHRGGSESAGHSAHVVGKAEAGSPRPRREQFRNESPEGAEVSRSEETDEGTEDQEERRIAGIAVDIHQNRADEQIRGESGAGGRTGRQ